MNEPTIVPDYTVRQFSTEIHDWPILAHKLEKIGGDSTRDIVSNWPISIEDTVGTGRIHFDPVCIILPAESLQDVREMRESMRHSIAHGLCWATRQEIGHSRMWLSLAEHFEIPPTVCSRIRNPMAKEMDKIRRRHRPVRVVLFCPRCDFKYRRRKHFSRFIKWHCPECGGVCRHI